MTRGAEWWEKRAVQRYREVRRLNAKLAEVEALLERRALDCCCKELADEIRTALGGVA